jgi:glutathione S-transferase
VPKLTLVSSPTCPFVQRAIISLKEKQQPFEVVYVDLQNRPDWFVALSPLGKVPLLKVGRPGREEAVLFESNVIVEYLEEAVEGAKLHPADPLEKAQHRAWMEYGSAVLGDLFRFYSATDPAQAEAAREALVGKLKRLEDELGDGPYFAGERFSAVDTVFGPVFRQIDLLTATYGVRVMEGLPKVTGWARALAARPSVRDAVPADYADLFLARLKAVNSHLLTEAA